MSEPRTEIVLPGKPMAETLRFFRETLGLRLDSILPADDPQTARLSGDGIRIVLDAAHEGPAGLLQVVGDRARDELRAPNGTTIRFVQRADPLHVPPADDRPVVTPASDSGFGVGRAGMQYRDLIPGRMGGHLIASHIRIPDGGPVPDDVHFHDVRFQMIYCYRGEVRLVYEDQGPPFVMRAGDCVLQPPGIRHRVLEASAGLEVVELACPSVHLTSLDHELELPTPTVRPGREWQGQRFHLHRNESAIASEDPGLGWTRTDLGLTQATGGIADVDVLQPPDGNGGPPRELATEACWFLFVLEGSCECTIDDTCHQLATGASACIPAGHRLSLREHSPDLQLLRVRLP